MDKRCIEDGDKPVLWADRGVCPPAPAPAPLGAPALCEHSSQKNWDEERQAFLERLLMEQASEVWF